MAKQLLFDQEARASMKEGIDAPDQLVAAAAHKRVRAIVDRITSTCKAKRDVGSFALERANLVLDRVGTNVQWIDV